ncbi:MAG: BolA family transcriptional regulator, partial [Emcibacter sp.]|nr:BolA family transcriptional regulator [Emcibacter sp.]
AVSSSLKEWILFMSVAQTIEQKLRDALNITSIEVVDESYKHAGHAGAPGGGESHFQLAIVSSDFAGKNRVARQREIYRILKAEMAGPIHALSIDAKSPQD